MCDYCSWIDQILARIKVETKAEKKKPVLHVDPVIIVHGGAGRIPRKEREYMLLEVKNAAIQAYSELIKGRSSVDAVEKAISYMESKLYFNCAKGGSLDVNDEIVTDAAIVSTHQAGCVGAVRDIEHPISLARKVMENREEVLIVEKGAQKFALEMGIPILPPGYLNARDESLTSKSSREDLLESFSVIDHESDFYYEVSIENQWDDTNEEEKEKKTCPPECTVPRTLEETCPYSADSTDSNQSSTIEPIVLQAGAVGAVAYDRKKRLASGASTSGEPRKPSGSISAIGTVIGCGVYANEHGCVSISGEDSSIYCYTPARKIIERLNENVSIDCAVMMELGKFVKRTGESRIGVIALNANGEDSVLFKSMHFPWAVCRKGYVYYGCARDENFSEEVSILQRPLDCMCESSDET